MSWIKENIKTVHHNSNTSKKQRQFGLLIVVLLVLICGVSIYKEGLIFTPKQIYIVVGLVVILIILFVFPRVFYPFLFIWLFIGNILGEISSFIILGIVYYLMFSPIAFILKITNKKKVTTGWIEREETIDYEKLY